VAGLHHHERSSSRRYSDAPGFNAIDELTGVHDAHLVRTDHARPGRGDRVRHTRLRVVYPVSSSMSRLTGVE